MKVPALTRITASDQNGNQDTNKNDAKRGAQIWGVDTDGILWSNFQLSPGSDNYGWIKGWNNQTDAPSPNGVIDLVACRQGDMRVQIWVLTKEQRLYSAYQFSAGGNWSKWKEWEVPSNPLVRLCASEQNGNQDSSSQHVKLGARIWGVDSDGILWSNLQNSPGGNWSGWSNGDGTGWNGQSNFEAPLKILDLAACRQGDMRTQIWALATDKTLHTTYQVVQGGEWSAWEQWATPPTPLTCLCASEQNGQHDPFDENPHLGASLWAVDTNGVLWNTYQQSAGADWSVWSSGQNSEGWNSQPGAPTPAAIVDLAACTQGNSETRIWATSTETLITSAAQNSPGGEWGGWYRDQIAFSLALNGIDSYGSTTIYPSYGFGNRPFTVEAWVCPGKEGGPVVAQLDVESGEQPKGWGLFVLPSQKLVFVNYDQRSSDYLSATSMNSIPLFDGSWHHVAAVRNGSEVQIYFDGLPIQVNLQCTQPGRAIDVDPVNAPLTIGWAGINYDSCPAYYTGEIDEVRLWNKGFEQWQLDQGIYHIMSASKPNLVAQYGFDDQDGKDTSGLGNHLEFHGDEQFDLPGFYFVPEGQPFFAVQSCLMQDYNWSESTSQGEETTTYRATISPRNSDGSKRSGHVKVWADQETTITSQGKTWIINSSTPAELETNLLQQVNITMEAGDSLIAPVLKIAADFMSPGERVVIPIDRQAHHALSMIQGDQLTSGKEPLLNPSEYDQKQADAVASVVRNIMSVTSQHDVQPEDPIINSKTPRPVSTRRVIRSRRYGAVEAAFSGEYQAECESYLPVDMPCPCCDPNSDLIKCHYLAMNTSVTRLTVSAFMPDPHWSFNVKRREFTKLGSAAEFAIFLSVQPNTSLESEELNGLWKKFVDGVLDVVDIAVSTG